MFGCVISVDQSNCIAFFLIIEMKNIMICLMNKQQVIKMSHKSNLKQTIKYLSVRVISEDASMFAIGDIYFIYFVCDIAAIEYIPKNRTHFLIFVGVIAKYPNVNSSDVLGYIQ